MREAQLSLQPCAAEALGRIADPAAFDGLRAALRDQSPAVRRKAAWALMRINDPRCVPDLAPLLDDADADVRGTVFEILKLFHTEEAVAALEAWRARRTAQNP
jgi:HEAT repeat protein